MPFLKYKVKLIKTILRVHFVVCVRKLDKKFVKEPITVDVIKISLICYFYKYGWCMNGYYQFDRFSGVLSVGKLENILNYQTDLLISQ